MAGTKRTGGGKPQSDFKRIKAKVGKKVPQNANVTDTAFKAASLHVAGQSIDNFSSDSPLLSARGKSLPELIASLGHPAAAVRLSAMKGLGNVVDQQSPYSLRPHLSILLPACAKSCVDEDQDVRTSGLSVFGGLLPQQDEATMRPFASLLVAYATSALHSLDSPMRIDGARFVNLLCSTYALLIKPFVPKLLPPFVGLLADRKAAKSSEVILQALVSILRISQETVGRRHAGRRDEEEPDLMYLRGGRSRNTLMLEIRKAEHSVRPFSSIRDLPSLDQVGGGSIHLCKSSSNQEEVASLEVASIYDLLSKLRDTLIEATESDNVAPGTAVSTAPMKAEKVQLLVQAIRLLWKSHGGPSAGGMNDSSVGNLNKLALQIVSLLLELFPITQDDIKASGTASIDKLNAAICTAIMDISSSIPSDDYNGTEDTKLDWMDTFSSYLLPRLDRLAEEQSSSSALDVFCGLLLLGEQNDKLASNRLIMLKRLYKAFFEEKNVELARSPAGRKIALTVAEIMKYHQYGLEKIEDSSKEILVKIIQRLPFYLISWGVDFTFESKVTIRFLHDVARHTIDPAEDPILASIREHMSEMVFAAGKNPKTKSRDKSIFELYPVSVQQKFLGLLVMLRSPSTETVKGLAAVCARSNSLSAGCNVGASIGDEIVESVQAVRKTIPMQGYLNFLVNSIGIPKAIKRATNEAAKSDSSEIDVNLVLMLDGGIRRVSHALIQCGSMRALQMLIPHLSSWLNTSSDLHRSDRFLRSRLAVAILAMLSFDMKSLDKESSIFNTAADMMQSLTLAICQAFTFISSSESAMEERSKLLSPFVAIIQAEPLLLDNVFKHVAEWTSNKTLKKSEQASIIQILIDFVKDPRLTDVVEGARESVTYVRSIESGLDDGTTSQMAGHLRAILEVRAKN